MAKINLRRLRESANLTQAKAAQLVGKTVRTWSSWENGHSKIPECELELFAIKVQELVDQKENIK